MAIGAVPSAELL